MEGTGCVFKDDSLTIKGKLLLKRPKSFSIIAMNLETTEDVDKVIQQCEDIKKQISSAVNNETLPDTGIELAEKRINLPQK